MDEQALTKAKILGVLIQDARLHAGRSVADCAAMLKMDADTFAQVEQGEQVISLPELEVLAMYLHVPMAHFWGSHTLGQPESLDFETFLELRQRILGVSFHHARTTAGMSVAELAAKTDIPAEEIERFELGQETISILKLENLAQALDHSLDDFVGDKQGPLARHEQAQKMQRHFAELPPEIQAFIAEPVNRTYLETAMQLSEMDVHRLRRIAEGILDITL